jgi:hypothetical protein
LLCTIHHVPIVDNSCLLITLVPDGAHDQEGRLTHCFEDTEKRPYCDEGGETEAEGVAAQSR